VSTLLKPLSEGGDPPASKSTRRKGRGGWWRRNDLTVIVWAVVIGFLIVILWPFVFVEIPSGHGGVYYSLFFGGTDVQWVRKEGFQLKFPWDTIFDYDVRVQQVVYDYSVISLDGLVVQFKVSIRYRPRLDRLGLLQKNIGPNYVQTIVVPETQQAIREVVGDNSAEKTYTTSIGVLEEALDRVIEELTGKYITIDTVKIQGVDIPDSLKAAIERKLAERQNALQYDYVIAIAQKEAERKRIEAQGIRDFQNIVTPGISENFLRWKGIEATIDLAKSNNAKVVVIGSQNGLPLILDTSSATANQTPVSPLVVPAPGQEYVPGSAPMVTPSPSATPNTQ
jgi:regulator of protease activity HflC (stomatin/prohibitin superfamily)